MYLCHEPIYRFFLLQISDLVFANSAW